MRHTECASAAASISLLLAAENEDIIAGCWAARISNERVMLNLGDLLLGAQKKTKTLVLCLFKVE